MIVNADAQQEVLSQAMAFPVSSNTYSMASQLSGKDGGITKAEAGALYRTMAADIEAGIEPAAQQDAHSGAVSAPVVGNVEGQAQGAGAPAAAEMGAAGADRQNSAAAFIAAGDDVLTATAKGAVMDRVLAGDQTLTNKHLRRLNMNSPSTRKVFEQLTGSAVPMTTDTATLLNTARTAVESAAQAENSNAPAPAESGAVGVNTDATAEQQERAIKAALAAIPATETPTGHADAAQAQQDKARYDPLELIRADLVKKNNAVSELDTATQAQNESTEEAKQPGFYSRDLFNGSAEDAAYLDNLAKVAGVSIEMTAQDGSSNGWIVNGKVYISEGAEDPARIVAKHEITHHLQDAAEESYMQYRSFVEQIFRERGSLDQQIRSIQELYARNGIQLTREQALDELAADFAGELIENETLIRRIAIEDRSLAQRILDAIRDLLRRVRTALGSADARKLDQAARLWEAALADANAAYKRGEVEANTTFADEAAWPTQEGGGEYLTTAGGVKYSLKMSFEEQVDSALNGELDRNTAVFVMNTPEMLQALGLKEYPMLITQRHIRDINHAKSPSNSHWHGLSEDIIKKLPDMIANPVMLLESTTAGDVVAVSPVLDGDGLPVIVSIHPDGSGHYNRTEIASNFVTSMYGKKSFAAFVNSAINDDRVLYVNKKRIRSLYSRVRLQLPKSLDRDGFIKDSIARQEDAVNSDLNNGKSVQTKHYSLKNSDMEAAQGAADVKEKFSVKGSRELQRRIDSLERQNQRLKEQMKRTDIPKKNRQAVEQTAEELRREFSSKIDKKELADRLDSLYESMHAKSGAHDLFSNAQMPTWDNIRAEARSIAESIIEQSTANASPLYREYGALRSKLKNEEITIPESARSELRMFGYDGYNDFKKRNANRLVLTEDGRSVASLYSELNEKYPDLFPDDMLTAGEQLVRISDVLQDLETLARDPFAYSGDAAQFVAGEIEERFYQTPRQNPTWADKEYLKRERQRKQDLKILRAEIRNHGDQHERDLKALRERYAQANLERIEKQNASQRRETIYRHAFRLGKKLLRPTNKQHVPEELRGAALNLVQYINLESGFEYDFAKDAMYHRVVPGSVLGAEKTDRTLAAIELQKQLKEIAKSEALTIDPEMDDYLQEIAEMGGKTLQDMSRSELDTVWKVMQIVENTISKANELHSEGRYRAVSDMADAIENDTAGRKGRKTFVGVMGGADKLINFDMLTPETFLHKMGKAGDELFRMMRKAEDRQIEILKEGVEKARKLVEASGVDFSKLDKELHTFDLEDGSITLSTSQIMELYALTQRKQAIEHIYKGGLKSIGAVKNGVEKRNAQPVRVTDGDVAEMISKLTDKQKKLMDGLQKYLSSDLAEHGNAESMKVYGYKKFKEEHYWPIKVSKTEVKSDPTSEVREKTIPGYGMTKLTKPKANNPVELRSAMDSFTAHLNQMSTYAAWLGTNEDITRLLNFQYLDKDESVRNTVKRVLESVYGENGEKYLKNLLGDIAQGTKAGQDKALSEAMTARWKAAKVGGNIRVVVQQPTAIIRAATMLNPKYFASAGNPKKGWEKAVKYSQIAQWKDWGYFELDTGRSLRELIVGTESTLDKVKNAFMWAAGAADSVTWGHLWNAVEKETADRRPELMKGSKEFYQAAAERFGEIIDRTQVVDSVLHRTQIMRSGNALNKMATSFMSEPSKVYNIVARDVSDLVSAESDAAKKRAWKATARSASVLILSFAVNALTQSLVDGLRDDDRDKEYGEKFAESYFGFTGDEETFGDYFASFWDGNFQQNFNPFGYIPYIKDVVSIIQGYSVDRSDMALVTELVNAMTQLRKSISGDGQKTVLATGLEAACKLGDLLGLPVSNLKRDAAAIVNTVLNEADLFELQYELDKLVYNEENATGVFYGDIYRSMNADLDAYEDIYEDFYEGMIERGIEEDEAESDIKRAMETRMKNELRVESVKSLPVRWSPPSEKDSDDVKIQKFFQLLRMGEGNGGWSRALDDEVLALAHEVDAAREGTDLDRALVIARSGYDERFKQLMMMSITEGKALTRYMAVKKAGVSTKDYVEVLVRAAEIAEARGVKSASQADVKTALNESGLTNTQKRAIWNSYIDTGVWKTKSPW